MSIILGRDLRHVRVDQLWLWMLADVEGGPSWDLHPYQRKEGWHTLRYGHWLNASAGIDFPSQVSLMAPGGRDGGQPIATLAIQSVDIYRSR